MKLDRAAFLSLAAALSAVATAACGSGAAEDDATEGALEQNGAQCADARRVDSQYPVAEGCFVSGLEGGPLAQCLAWSNHFEAGVAHRALENLGNGSDWSAVYDAGRKALEQTCPRSQAEEAQLARFCDGVRADRNECLTYARGIRAESRGLLKKCVNDKQYPLYSCVEGLGWDESPEKCVTPDEAGGGSGFGCPDLPAGQATCERVTSTLRAHIAQESIGCMIRAMASAQEASPRIDGDGIATSCGLATLTRTCQDVTVAQAPCEALVDRLKAIDPQLASKDHLNAGGRFTKQCRGIFSGLNEKGRSSVGTCIESQARAAGSGVEIKKQVSFTKCLAAGASSN